MDIKYLGHSCLLVESNNNKVIIDPFLSGNPTTSIDHEKIEVDAVIITHGHSDHIGDAVSIAQKNNSPIITNYELAMYLSKQGVSIHPLLIGGSHTFDWGTVKLTQAVHSSGIDVSPDEILYGGMPAGILLTMDHKTLFHAGDTGLFGDMKIIGELNDIDVAALPIGDNFTMGIEDATIAAQWLKAKKYIPIHFNTFDLIKQDPNLWVEKMTQHNLEVKVLDVEESLKI